MSSLRKDLHAGERMKTIRQSRHLTQDQLARAAGVSRSLVAQWETGRSGFAGKAAQIARVLEIPVRMLRPEAQAEAGSLDDMLPSSREQLLLQSFRELQPDDQSSLLHIVRRLTSRS